MLKLAGLVAFAAVVSMPLIAQQQTFDLDAAQTEITWMLGGSLHTVHGSFKLKQGALRLDPDTGKASGEIVIDVASGESGNGPRDHRMHKEILESQKFPEAAFTPDHFDGKVAAEGESRVSVHGNFKIHGADHELTLDIQVSPKAGQFLATTHFVIPYVKWGMKNPSNFLLKVDDKVTMDIRTTARASIASTSAAH